MVTSHGSAALQAGRPGRTRGTGPGRHRAARACAVLATAAIVSVVTACGSSSAGSGAKSALVVADVAPFSGVDAALGPTYLVSCDGATQSTSSSRLSPTSPS